MPNLIHQTKRMQIFIEESKGFMEIVLWHDFEEIDIFKQDLMEFIGLAADYKIQKNLWNLQKLQIVIEPELQEWIDENINQIELAWGVKKEAFILQNDIIAELSIEQTMQTQPYGEQIDTQLFSDYDRAVIWLLAD